MYIIKIIGLVLLASTSAHAVELETFNAPKGYVLSIDLQKKECERIWTRQIPIFKKNNPGVKDLNIIQIGQELIVQNCQKNQDENIYPENIEETSREVSENKEPENKTPPESKQKKQSDDYFIGLSGVYHRSEKKNSDSKKRTTGYKGEIGRYFKVNEDELKVSLGFIRTKSKYDKEFVKDLEFDRFMFSLDFSYLSSVGGLRLGPNFGLLRSAFGTQFKNPMSEENKTSAFAGVNALYDLSKNISIDFKVNNQIEKRINVMSTLGLELRF